MYKRKIQQHIEQWLFKGKVIVIYGPRQVGKTTLAKHLLEKYSNQDKAFSETKYKFTDSASPYKYLNCDLISIRQAIETENEEQLKQQLGNAKLVILDEAQRIENIGLILKILVDTYPDIQIIATGSSSFDLSNKLKEPLTGRAIQYMLCPLSLQELSQKYDFFKIEAKLENVLRYGSYPELIDSTEAQAREILEMIASNYLYKDILEFENIKNSKLLYNLLQLLALQVGNDVSYQELANNLGINVLTVKKYIDLLEKCFIIFSLNAFSRNYRKEISKSIKVYFYDLGIRNKLIQNFNPLNIRNDTGALWENFCISERIKYNNNNRLFLNMYFWRTYDQKEIDYIEEHSGRLDGYEFKWGKESKTYKPPRAFLNSYENSKVTRIDQNNYWSFLVD
ncbi:MAG: ATP-binding protein [Cyanobacteriota bacterium]